MLFHKFCVFFFCFTQTFQIHLVLPHLAFWRILMSNFLHQLARVLFDWFHCWCLLSLCACDKESSCWTWLTLVCAEIEERQYKQISVNGSIPLSPRHIETDRKPQAVPSWRIIIIIWIIVEQLLDYQQIQCYIIIWVTRYMNN